MRVFTRWPLTDCEIELKDIPVLPSPGDQVCVEGPITKDRTATCSMTVVQRVFEQRPLPRTLDQEVFDLPSPRSEWVCVLTTQETR